MIPNLLAPEFEHATLGTIPRWRNPFFAVQALAGQNTGGIVPIAELVSANDIFSAIKAEFPNSILEYPQPDNAADGTHVSC